MKTNEEIRNEVDREWFDDAKVDAPYLIQMVDEIQNATLLNQLTVMENLALWKGGNTAEEKIQHFFKVLQMAKDELTQT